MSRVHCVPGPELRVSGARARYSQDSKDKNARHYHSCGRTRGPGSVNNLPAVTGQAELECEWESDPVPRRPHAQTNHTRLGTRTPGLESDCATHHTTPASTRPDLSEPPFL